MDGNRNPMISPHVYMGPVDISTVGHIIGFQSKIIHFQQMSTLDPELFLHQPMFFKEIGNRTTI